MGYNIPEDHHGSTPAERSEVRSHSIVGADSSTGRNTLSGGLDHVELQRQAALQVQNRSSNKDNILRRIRSAMLELNTAYQDALSANPMAASVPAFQRLQKLSKDAAEVMQEVSKVRGL